MPYRRTERVTARLAETRRNILDAARRLIAEGGFSAVQMAAVAAEADIATGTLYRHFSNKAALCREVFREVSAREMSLLASIAASDRPPPARLEAAVRSFASRAIRGRRLAYALLAEPIDLELTEERSFFRRTHAEILSRIVRAGIKSGDFPDQNAEMTAACLAGAIPTALVGPLAPESHVLDTREDDVVASLLDFCFRAAGAPADEARFRAA